jgi:hypothetical protein
VVLHPVALIADDEVEVVDAGVDQRVEDVGEYRSVRGR